MNLEKFLSYVTHHSETIIQWLFFGILLLAGTLIARSLFGKKREPETGGDLQSALEKILAQTTKLENVSLDKLSSQGVAQVEAQVQTLKADLAARETELNQFKSGGGKNSEEASALAGRIKELEAKLSEYEILEDDIADLSLYKEENARLKTELDRLKSAGEVGDDAAATAAVNAAVQAPAGEDIVAEFAQAVGESDVESSNDSPDVEIPDTGDPMADFESTVQLEKKLTTEPAKASSPPPQHSAEPVAAPPVESQQEADDLFAEFSSAAPDEESATLDTDKMMAEMAALVSMEPATESALEESIDTDKMAAEASQLPKS